MYQDDVEKYLKKSGDERIYTDNLIENENGFASYRIVRDKLIILNCYGNGKYWDERFMEIAQKNNCKAIKFGTRRNCKAFIRKFGYTLKGYILEKGVK